jgi:hypothetical protein
MQSIENLTPAQYRRYLAVLDAEPALDHADTAIQDRWLLEQTTHWLQKRNSHESPAQLFVRLKTPAHRLQNLRRWLHRVMSVRSTASQQQLVLVTHTERVASSVSRKGIDSIDMSGVSVCIEAKLDNDVFEALLESDAVKYVYINDCNLAQRNSTDALNDKLSRCRNAGKQTLTTIHSPAEIASAWQMGIDCVIDGSQVRPVLTAAHTSATEGNTTAQNTAQVKTQTVVPRYSTRTAFTF